VPVPAPVRPLFGLRGTHPNIADADSETSVRIARHMFSQMRIRRQANRSSQAIGSEFEKAIKTFLENSLPRTLHGRSVIVSGHEASAFEQYRHLEEMQRLIAADASGTLRATIGTDYRVKPDVTVSLTGTQGKQAFLHAAVQCKWTLRSDRAQNVRHDAVMLIRNRRGRLPHIVPVTAEPLPTRLASLARGTGEIDALYHVAFDELIAAVPACGNKQQAAALDELVGHGRLRDLNTLPSVLQL
jgi:hypothetical protein